jgi:hypothetical protein
MSLAQTEVLPLEGNVYLQLANSFKLNGVKMCHSTALQVTVLIKLTVMVMIKYVGKNIKVYKQNIERQLALKKERCNFIK